MESKRTLTPSVAEPADDARAVGLFTHPEKSYKKGQDVKDFAMIRKRKLVLHKGKGIVGDRFYGKSCHVTAIETEEIELYSKIIGQTILPGQLRSNIETKDINLSQLFLDNDERPVFVKWGPSVVLKIYALRTPCWKMNDIPQDKSIDLERLMWGQSSVVNGKEVTASDRLNQGVKMRVVEGGEIAENDRITVIEYNEEKE